MSTELPHLAGRPMVTDGGMETDLIFHHGVDLPCFASFPLLNDDTGRRLLADYYAGYAQVAAAARAGLLLESRPGGPTRTGVPSSVTPWPVCTT